MTEKLFTGTLNHNQNKKQKKSFGAVFGICIFIILVISHFDFNGRILILIVQVLVIACRKKYQYLQSVSDGEHTNQ